MALTKITKAMMGDNNTDSDSYVDGSIDEAHLSDNAVSLAKMAGGTDGQIITYDASGNPTAVGPGTDGQVLTSTGAGSPPAFEANAGGFKFLAYTSGSDVSAIEFDASDGIDNTTYAGYFFNITRMFPHTNGRVGMRVSDDDGSTWKTSGYKMHLHSIDMDGLEQVGCSTSENTIRLCTNSNGNSAGFFSNCQIYFPVETLSFEYGFANIQGSWREDSSSYDAYSCYGGGSYAAGSAAGGWDAFQFLSESGNITGKITMYGLVKA